MLLQSFIFCTMCSVAIPFSLVQLSETQHELLVLFFGLTNFCTGICVKSNELDKLDNDFLTKSEVWEDWEHHVLRLLVKSI